MNKARKDKEIKKIKRAMRKADKVGFKIVKVKVK